VSVRSFAAWAALALLGCGAEEAGSAPAMQSSSGGAAGAGGGGVPPFMPPDTTGGSGYVPAPGSCGLETPAFCADFESEPAPLGRSGELDPLWWSATRGMPSPHADFSEAFSIGPALIPDCRPGLTGSASPPDADTVLCDPNALVPTRHLLTASAAQNYGLNAYRIRQPFDFAGRTGTIKLDVDLSNNGLGGWPALAISADPTLVPSFDFPERGSGPRDGVLIEFNGGWCNTPNTVLTSFYSYADYVESAQAASFDCEIPHVTTQREALNRVEVRVSSSHLEVWASDASSDGQTFGELVRLFSTELTLPFERGYVSLVVRNHATLKYWQGGAWAVRWDNVGFDGPLVTGLREYSAPQPMIEKPGLEGCLVSGECQWRGSVIAARPGDSSACDSPEEECTFDAAKHNVGYVVPNEDEAPIVITIPAVDPSGIGTARLALAVDYPWFEWNGQFPAPSAMGLRYRLNGGAWHERFVSDVEVNAFAGDFESGGGPGAGLLNQLVDVEVSELIQGDNLLELTSLGLWTGSYRAAIAGVDLVLAE
jgi:hypothetical protein